MFVLGGEAVQVTESWYFPLLFWDKDTIDVLKIIATQYSSKGGHFKKQCRKIPAIRIERYTFLSPRYHEAFGMKI